MSASESIRFEMSGPPDAAAFQRLYDSTGWAGGLQREPEFYARALTGSWAQCAAYAGEELVGFGRVISDGVLHAFITEMIVLPPWQGQGLGAQLLDRLVQHCLQQGLRDIQLFCAEGKQAFYEKGGFTPRLPGRPGMQYTRCAEASESPVSPASPE
ncbi:MAG: GNAT family N-acetyltransferase [Paucibacter sp.]|nr:GNAT family N-acetyltransferase [Roseateles sp.]